MDPFSALITSAKSICSPSGALRGYSKINAAVSEITRPKILSQLWFALGYNLEKFPQLAMSLADAPFLAHQVRNERTFEGRVPIMGKSVLSPAILRWRSVARGFLECVVVA